MAIHILNHVNGLISNYKLWYSRVFFTASEIFIYTQTILTDQSYVVFEWIYIKYIALSAEINILSKRYTYFENYFSVQFVNFVRMLLNEDLDICSKMFNSWSVSFYVIKIVPNIRISLKHLVQFLKLDDFTVGNKL